MAGFFTVGADSVECRLWVQYNGTDQSIRDDYNVSTIADHGTGQHTVNFTVNMPNDDYCVAQSTGTVDGSNASGGLFVHSQSTSVVRTYNTNHGDQAKDRNLVCVAIFGAGA